MGIDVVGWTSIIIWTSSPRFLFMVRAEGGKVGDMDDERGFELGIVEIFKKVVVLAMHEVSWNAPGEQLG